MTIVQTLCDIRSTIINPDHWTQYIDARDVDGTPIDPIHDDAYCFCLDGALERVRLDDLSYDGAAKFLNAEAELAGQFGYHHFNDSHTHAEVIALVDRALAKAHAVEAIHQETMQ